jgi:multiple sugar transport system substrate-binding protein
MELTRKKIITIGMVVGGIIILLLIVSVLWPKKTVKPAYLVVWGVYDEEDVFKEQIAEYAKQNKGIAIKYEKKNPETYEDDLIRAFAENKAPDIWMMHNTWLPKYKTLIKELPDALAKEILPFESFKNSFVDVAEKDLSENSKIYGLPLYVDTLAMFYNKDFFNSEGIASPPQNWDELVGDMDNLIKKDQWGQITRAGVAMGTAENINRATDILSLLMLQNGTKMVSDDKKKVTFSESVRLDEKSYYPGQEALRFYTDFSNPSKRIYTWNRQMRYSIDAFIEGKTAIMFNYSHQISTIKARAPYLNFAVISMPQVKDRNFDINYANYWAFTVSKKSKSTENERIAQEAWKFIVFLTQQENSKKYLEKAKKPTARKDLVDWQRSDLELGVFAKQSLTAQSWYQINNLKIEKIFIDAIDSIVLGSASVEKAIDVAASQANLEMGGAEE